MVSHSEAHWEHASPLHTQSWLCSLHRTPCQFTVYPHQHNHKIIKLPLLLLHNHSFATDTNCNVSIWYKGYLICNWKGATTYRLRTTPLAPGEVQRCSRAALFSGGEQLSPGRLGAIHSFIVLMLMVAKLTLCPNSACFLLGYTASWYYSYLVSAWLHTQPSLIQATSPN